MSIKNIFIILLVCSISLTFIGNVSADEWYTADIPMDYQENDHYCGPASLRMIGLSWGIDKSQDTIASNAGTSGDGTGHGGLSNAASKLFSASYSEWLWSNVDINGYTKDFLLSGTRYIFHIMTGTLKTDAYGNSLWQGDYGHYIVLKGVNPDRNLFKINDPTKGTIDLTYDQLKKATAQISQKSVLSFNR
ncbi:MAG: C39 family peptidase [Methanobrevibacter sp.]|nr:C39 family peptidase [Candidatus Methanovirga aequatorialis]